MHCYCNNNLNRTHHWSNVLRHTLHAAFLKKNSKISWNVVFFAHPPKGLHFVLRLHFYIYWELFKQFKALSFGFHHENSHLPQKSLTKVTTETFLIGPHALECTISKNLVVCLSALLPHFTAYSLSYVHASQTNVEVGLDVLLKFKSLTMSCSIKMLFTSKCPSQLFQSTHTWTHEVDCICSAYLHEGHLVQIPSMLSYCNHVPFAPPILQFNHVKLHFNPFKKILPF